MSPPAKGSLDAVEWVSPDIIRKLFNEGQYYQKMLANELTVYLKKDSVLEKPPTGEPAGTRSQTLYYYDLDENFVAVVHQYLRPDGTLGGSGKPDPKRLALPDRIVATRG